MKPQGIPLIEQAEVRYQDRRNDLIAAFRKLAGRRRTPPPTDLHVRELLTYILARDGGNEGLQISYSDLATHLDCTTRTARTVVERAVKEFGLIEAIEQRYASSGQTANLYRILWPVVRYTLANNGDRKSRDLDCPRGDAQRHPPDAQRHPPDAERQPTTLCIPLVTSLGETTTTEPSRTAHGPGTAWDVVVVALEENHITLVERAIAGAQKLGYDPQRCMDLVRQFRELPEDGRKPGVLYRWLTMRNSAPKTAKIDSPAARETITNERRKRRREKFRADLFREDRQRWSSASDAEIEAEIDRLIAISESIVLTYTGAKSWNS